MKITQLFVTKGYVEEEVITHIVFGHVKGFRTAAKALEALREAFIQIAHEENDGTPACCKGASPTDKMRFCPTCGRELLTAEEVVEHSRDKLLHLLNRLFFGTIDSTSRLREQFNALGWEFGVMSQGGFTMAHSFDRYLTGEFDSDEILGVRGKLVP